MPKHQEPEIVEDSEPEREAARQRAKAIQRQFSTNRVARPAKSKEPPSLPMHSMPVAEDDSSELEVLSVVLPRPSGPGSASSRDATPFEFNASVHEISSSPHRPAGRGGEVIEISDESFQDSQEKGKRVVSTGVLNDSVPSSPSFSSPPVAPLDALPGDNGGESAGSTSGSRFSKFRYVPPTRPSRPIVRCASTSSAVSESSKSAVKRPKRTHALSDTFSDKDLEKVLKCVSCNTRWTVRKTAFQKVTHMVSCCKKNGINPSGLAVMVQNAIGISLPVPPPGPTISAERMEKPNTLYSTMVGDETKKKTGKRIKAPTTVSDVSAAQQGIMDRAMDVIRSTNRYDCAADCSVRSQAVQTRGRRSSVGLEHTQTFGESALAGLYGSSAKMVADDYEPSQPFPATQGFAPSALGALHTTSTSSRTVFRELGANSPYRADFTAPPPERSRSRSNSFHSDVRSDPGVYWDDQYGALDQNDDAILHFSPERNAPRNNTPPPQDEPRSAAPKPAKKDIGKKKAVTSSVEDWESKLKYLITSDKELHLRILRYEPIAFSVFMEKVGINPSAQAQKQKLRSMLDELGVNSYAVSGMVGRRRTRK